MNILKNIKQEGLITNELYEKIKPIYGQLTTLSPSTKPTYYFARPGVVDAWIRLSSNCYPTWPTLRTCSKVWPCYPSIADCLSSIPECQINSSTQKINHNSVVTPYLKGLVSFDVSYLYTNVPVTEAINVWANLLF